ncbi:MAG: helix-turn-helix domain-containing protein [Lachnospiraceae bacterium]|nr:helix-turn-helix domain-containing protein [Lachnospiraceae bacterium]
MLPRMKFIRRGLHLSQEQTAAHLHISRQAYGAYERGERKPPAVLLAAFCDLTGVSLDYLLEREDILPPIPLTAGEEELLRIYRALDDNGQEYILRQIEYEEHLCKYFQKKES